MVAWLVSEENSFTTGAVFDISGDAQPTRASGACAQDHDAGLLAWP